MRRGRSVRTFVGLGLEGWKGSEGHDPEEPTPELNVGVVKAAVLV
jgi:hypothetical protein